MNIFALSEDPREAAGWHNDRHVVKMIVEYAQLMSTAHRVLDGTAKIIQVVCKSGKIANKKVWQFEDPKSINKNAIYKATHINHPSAIWVRQSKQNYEWLFHLWLALLDEWRSRYNHTKTHKCEALKELLASPPTNIQSDGKTPVLLAMPDEYKISDDPIICYRQYYKIGKAHLAKWRGKDAPPWFY